MSKRSTTSKKRAKSFDPIAFLKTAAKGRAICKYPSKRIIFAQGDAADSVHYIQSGKVKNHCRIPRRQGSRCRNAERERVLR